MMDTKRDLVLVPDSSRIARLFAVDERPRPSVPVAPYRQHLPAAPRTPEQEAERGRVFTRCLALHMLVANRGCRGW